MIGQMTIFDIAPEIVDYPDFRVITEETAAEVIGDALAVRFAYDKNFSDWRAKVGGMVLTMAYSTYYESDKKFVSVGYHRKDRSGGGAPCDGIAEAVEWLKKRIEENA